MKKVFHNTKSEGVATVFLYRKDSKFIGVCLELDIVDDGSDFDELRQRMRQNVESYIRYVCSKDADESLLNRPAPKEYWDMFSDLLSELKQSSSHTRHFQPSGSNVSSDFAVDRFRVPAIA